MGHSWPKGQRTTLLIATGTLALLSHPAHSQTAPEEDDGGLADIVVTAQRRAESVQDIPIPVSVFNAEQLEAQGITNTLQLGQYVPNLIAQSNTGIGSANAYFLRGLGNAESIATFDPPVGTYVDDVYLSRQNANNLALFDVERVEVLRGPQGTLFGRNTTGGAVNIIMRKPEFDRVSGFAVVGYGSYDKKIARASIDLPLAPTFAIKLSGYWQDDDGYVRNVTTGERTNDDDGFGVRLALRGELGESVRWNGSYAYIESNGENIVNFDCNPADLGQCSGRFNSTGLPEGRRFATSPFAPLSIAGEKAFYGLGNYTQTNLITSTLDFDIGSAATLSLITGYVAVDQQFALDFFDGRASASIANPYPPVQGYPRGGFNFVNDGQHEEFTQEVKLNGTVGDAVTYVAGVYYIHETNRTDFADVLTLSSTTSLLLADRIVRNSTSAIAGYAQADLDITPDLTLTAGIRYTDETKRVSVQDNRANCLVATPAATCLTNANLVSSTGVAIPRTLKSKLWTPRVAINFTPADDVLLFASATRGFKSGGWNARASSPSAFLPFDAETVWSYEAGIKSELFDRRLRANLTAFYLTVDKLQTISGIVNPVTGAFTSLTRNFADYRNKGIEAEFTANPAPGLSIFLNVGYQDDRYVVDRNVPATDIYGVQSVPAQQAACLASIAAGRISGGPNTASCGAGIVTASGGIATPVRTPDWTVAVGGSYEAPLSDTLTLIPSVNASFRSVQEVATANYTIFTGSVTGTNGTFPANPTAGDIITGSKTPAAWVVNAGLTLKAADRWRVTLECKNCFDKSFSQGAIGNYSYLNLPRSWMLQTQVDF